MHNTPTTFGRQGVTKIPARARLSRHDSRLAGEIIPDSEEERQKVSIPSEVIEISSGEDDPFTQDTSLEELFLPIPGSWPSNNGTTKKPRVLERIPNLGQSPAKAVKPTPRKTYRARRIILSSSSEDSDDENKVQAGREIIELSDNSPEPLIPNNATARRLINTGSATATQVEQHLCSDGEATSDDGGAILTLDEPRSTRKPLRLPSHIQGRNRIPAGAAPESKRLQNILNPSDITITLDHPTPVGTPTRQKLSVAPSTPISTTKAGAKTKQAPRTGKKAQAAAEQARRQLYAQEVFDELNRTVFEGGLPKDTKLNWSKRLLTTAGKAKWHRSREGVQTTEIELADKILDCDGRIRNTLSHEMCHLASWIINGDPREGHGRLWKAWAAKVMHKHPEIAITTRHSYEISYTYQWKCQMCAKIYGRFSNSIRVDECVCGACKEGKLTPLFVTRASKAPKTPKTSRMASTRPQDSPRSIPLGMSRIDSGADNQEPLLYTIHDSDSDTDSDIAVLATAMGSVTFVD